MGFLRLCVFLFLATACGEKKEPPSKMTIVTTYSILADIISHITEGSGIEVKTLVPRLSDPHTYEPKPEDFVLLSHANLIFAHGLRFEGWFERILGTHKECVTFVAAPHPTRILDDGSIDPHTWHDPTLMKMSIPLIVEKLSINFPAYAGLFHSNAENYIKNLEDLDMEIASLFKNLPTSTKRIVLTTHDSFYYFGKRYGIEFIAPLGITTDAEPKAQTLSKIIERIKKEGIRAIFIENLSNQHSLHQISKETGIDINGILYADSLSEEKGPAATYIEMLRYNATAIRNALVG